MPPATPVSYYSYFHLLLPSMTPVSYYSCISLLLPLTTPASYYSFLILLPPTTPAFYYSCLLLPLLFLPPTSTRASFYSSPPAVPETDLATPPQPPVWWRSSWWRGWGREGRRPWLGGTTSYLLPSPAALLLTTCSSCSSNSYLFRLLYFPTSRFRSYLLHGNRAEGLEYAMRWVF